MKWERATTLQSMNCIYEESKTKPELQESVTVSIWKVFSE